jgi:hypothetical protein
LEWRCRTYGIEVWWFEKAAVRLLGCLCLHVLDAVGVDAVYAWAGARLAGWWSANYHHLLPYSRIFLRPDMSSSSWPHALWSSTLQLLPYMLQIPNARIRPPRPQGTRLPTRSNRLRTAVSPVLRCDLLQQGRGPSIRGLHIRARASVTWESLTRGWFGWFRLWGCSVARQGPGSRWPSAGSEMRGYRCPWMVR